jgi:predicted transcriptional regulator
MRYLDDESEEKKVPGKYEYFDWYDYYKVEKLNQSRANQWLKIYKKLRDTQEKGDQDATVKARTDLRKLDDENKILKKKAEEAGYYWC